MGRVVTGTLTFLWEEGFRDLIWESFGAGRFGGGVLSSGVQVGSLLPPLASCELACDPTVCPRCSLPSAQWARSTCSVLSMNYLWMQTGVISGAEAMALFSFCSLLCCCFPFLLRTGRRGNLIGFLSLFCSESGVMTGQPNRLSSGYFHGKSRVV